MRGVNYTSYQNLMRFQSHLLFEMQLINLASYAITTQSQFLYSSKGFHARREAIEASYAEFGWLTISENMLTFGNILRHSLSRHIIMAFVQHAKQWSANSVQIKLHQTMYA